MAIYFLSMKIKKFLLRYFPPGLTVLYEQGGREMSKTVDLLHFTADIFYTFRSRLDVYLRNLLLTEPVLTAAKKSQLEDILEKIQCKLKEPEKEYFYLNNVVQAHILPLTNVAFNKLGTQFVTGSYDRSCKLWNTDTADLCREFQGHEGVVYCVSFNNPYGDRILTGSFDTTAKLWNTETGELHHTFEGHTAQIVSAQFSPSCDRIATGCMDGVVKIWDVETRKCLASLVDHDGAIVAANFSNCQNYLLTGSFDATAIVYDCHDFRVINRLHGHKAEISQATFDRTSGQILTGSVDGTARIWDSGSGREMQILIPTLDDGAEPAPPILDAKFNNAGGEPCVALCGEGGYAALYSGADYGRATPLIGHSDEVSLVNFNPKGSRLLTSSADKTSRMWRVEDGKCCQVLVGHNDEIFSAAFNYDGDVIITASKDNTCRIWR